MAGLMTVNLMVFAIPAVLLLFSRSPSAGGVLLLLAGLMGAGRLYWKQAIASLEN